jgi:hypothetical protein
MTATEDEFAEFETDEATFDAMMAEAEPAELVPAPTPTTVTIEQTDDAVFTLTVPAGGLFWVGTATTASAKCAPCTRPAGEPTPDLPVDTACTSTRSGWRCAARHGSTSRDR